MSIIKKDTIVKLSWNVTPEYAAYHVIALRDIDLKAEHELVVEAMKKELAVTNEDARASHDPEALGFPFEPVELSYEESVRTLADELVKKGAAKWLKTQTHHLGLGLKEPSKEILEKFYAGELTE